MNHLCYINITLYRSRIITVYSFLNRSRMFLCLWNRDTLMVDWSELETKTGHLIISWNLIGKIKRYRGMTQKLKKKIQLWFLTKTTKSSELKHFGAMVYNVGPRKYRGGREEEPKEKYQWFSHIWSSSCWLIPVCWVLCQVNTKSLLNAKYYIVVENKIIDLEVKMRLCGLPW